MGKKGEPSQLSELKRQSRSQGIPRQLEFAGQSTGEKREPWKSAEGLPPVSTARMQENYLKGLEGRMPRAHTGLGIASAPNRQTVKPRNSGNSE